MLDENLPTFFIHTSPESPLRNAIYLKQDGAEPEPTYALRRPDPELPASKNRYAVALSDSYNKDVLYAEVLVEPEWTQPTLSAAEIRAQSHNGVPPGPIPVVPNSFTVQLYNPDQQVIVKQVPGTWNSSAYWEFEMPQQTFRVPSISTLDRGTDDPSASVHTPKLTFAWRRNGKLSKDITCYLSGKAAGGKKSKEPDITVAMYKHDRELTIYEPNMNRVELEDAKGFEVVLLLSSVVIKEIYFNPTKDLFNISNVSVPPKASRRSSGPSTIGRITTGLAMSGAASSGAPALASQTYSKPTPPRTTTPYPPSHQIPDDVPARPHAKSEPRPPPADPRTQWAIDAETARLKAEVERKEKEQKLKEEKEQKMIKKMLEQEEKERRRRDAEVAKETERLRKKYGVQPVPGQQSNSSHVQFAPPPPLPPRASAGSSLSPYYTAPHSRPEPASRPMSTPGHSVPAPSGPFHSSTLNTWWNGPNGTAPNTQSGPYLQPNAYGNSRPSGSTSGFFNWGHRDAPAESNSRLTKKRSSVW